MLLLRYRKKHKPVKNKFTLEQITNTVVDVQRHAIDLAEYDIISGVNIYARNSLKLLQSLGLSKEQVMFVLEEVYAGDIQQIDNSLSDVAISVMTISHMLSSNLQNIIYNRLCEMINAPNEHRIRTNVINGTVKSN